MTARSDRKPICSALLRVIFLLAKMYVESWEMLAAARMTASIQETPADCEHDRSPLEP